MPKEQRAKIFDSLAQILTTAGDKELIPVLIMVDDHRHLPEVELVAGPLQVTHRYQVVPALAATATKDQVLAISSQSFVAHIEHDAKVQICMDGANRWFGAAKARQDFAVNGDGDGSHTYSTEDIVVAVIDTGIDPNHVDFSGGKVLGWRDFVNNRPNPYDDNGHGTHCAGIAAGTGAGNASFVGVAPGAALVGLKVLDAGGSGSLSAVAAAVDWAVANKDTYGIRIISMSLGTSGSSDGTDTVSQAVNRAFQAGIVPVVAAGNSGPNRNTVGSPGAALHAITVGAMSDINHDGFGLASFSSRGPTRDGRTKPELVAPGVRIMAPRANSNNGYVEYSGTSMATPFVAGVVALMLSANPSLTPAQVRQMLLETTLGWGPSGEDNDYGWGRVDAWAAVKRAGSFPGGSPPTVAGHLHESGSLSASGQEATHTFTVTDPSYPVNVTMIMPDWAGTGSPDFERSAPKGYRMTRLT